jgi:hypothetical protein
MGVAKSEILKTVLWASEGSSAQRNVWKISNSKMVVASAMHGLGASYCGCQRSTMALE